MNTGQTSSSPIIRVFTNEGVLAFYRSVVSIGMVLVGFFLNRLVNEFDSAKSEIAALRREVAQQIGENDRHLAEFKVEVARTNAATAATLVAIQDRVNAQSRRSDGIEGDIRVINTRLYENRIPPK